MGKVSRLLLVFSLLMLSGLSARPATAQVASPSVQVLSPMNGATVPGPNVTLTLLVTGFTLAPTEIGTLPVAGHGHMHILVDGMLTSIVASEMPVLMGLAPGMHTVTVELHQNNHAPLTPPATATVTFTVV